MGMGDTLPLIIFTVVTQMVVGAFIVLWFVWQSQSRLLTLGPSITSAGQIPVSKPVNSGLFVLVVLQVLAIIVARLQLGQALGFFLALSNLGSSWLSRETLLTGLFFLSMTAVNFSESYRRQAVAVPLTAILGVLALMASGMIYVMPARPAWDSFWPMVSFLLTAWLAGVPLGILVMFGTAKGISPAAGSGWSGGVPVAAAGQEGTSSRPSYAGPMWYFFLAGIGVSVVVNILYLSTLADGRPDAAATLANILGSPLFWLRVVIGWLAPAGLLLLQGNRGMRTTWTILALVVVGEILGRAVFYGSVVPMGIFQFK